MDAIPEGWYAVPDPDNPDRLTFWSVDRKGVVRDFAHRWRPMPPVGVHPDVRAAWYAKPSGPYFTWRAEVAHRIAADLAGARAAFLKRYPDPGVIPPPAKGWPGYARSPRTRIRVTRRTAQEIATSRAVRDGQALVVVALHESGKTYRQIAKLLSIPLATVHRRAEHGETIGSMRLPTVEECIRVAGDAVSQGHRETTQSTILALLTGAAQPLDNGVFRSNPWPRPHLPETESGVGAEATPTEPNPQPPTSDHETNPEAHQ